MKQKTVVLIVGRSASGKDSVVRELTKLGYKQLISYTTRPRRIGETDTHIFITDEDVEKYKDDIIAYTEIGSNKYFATKQQLQDADLYVIDPKGIKYLKRNIKDIKFVTIHINLPTEERFKRALNRGDEVEDIIKRFNAENDQFDELVLNGEYDYSITNYNLNKTVEVVKKIIEVETKNE